MNDFVDVLDAGDGAMRAGLFHRAIEFRGERAVQNVVDERGFAGAGDAGDDGEQAERKRDVDIFQIVAVRAENRDRFSVGRRRVVGHGNFRAAGKILAGERCGIRGDFLGRAGGDEISAGVAGAGAEIDHVVGAANRFFVVLDDEDGVAEVAQGFERAEQAAIVARVQADGRLVENVEDAAQARADLRGQADALGFAAGERGGGTVESEIAEAHIEKKIEALGDFGERAAGDFSLARA